MSVPPPGPLPSESPPPPLKPSGAEIIASLPPPKVFSTTLIPPRFDWNKTMEYSLEALYRSTPAFLKPGAYILALLKTLIAWVSQTREKFVDQDVLTNQVNELALTIFTQFPEWKETDRGRLLEKKFVDLAQEIRKKAALTKEQAAELLRETVEELKRDFATSFEYSALQSTVEENRRFSEECIQDCPFAWNTWGIKSLISGIESDLITRLKQKKLSGAQIERLGIKDTFDWFRGDWFDSKAPLPSKEQVLQQYQAIVKDLKEQGIRQFLPFHRVFETALAHLFLFQIEKIKDKEAFVESVKTPLKERLSQYAIDVDEIFALTDVDYANLLSALGTKRDILLQRIEKEIAKRKEQDADAKSLQEEKKFLSDYLSDYRLAEDMAVFLERFQLSPMEELLQTYGPDEPISATDKQKVQEALTDEISNLRKNLLTHYESQLTHIPPSTLATLFKEIDNATLVGKTLGADELMALIYRLFDEQKIQQEWREELSTLFNLNLVIKLSYCGEEAFPSTLFVHEVTKKELIERYQALNDKITLFLRFMPPFLKADAPAQVTAEIFANVE